MFMPFGKYKNVELLQILQDNPDYIIWLSTIELHQNLKKEVNDILPDAIRLSEEIKEIIEENAFYATDYYWK